MGSFNSSYEGRVLYITYFTNDYGLFGVSKVTGLLRAAARMLVCQTCNQQVAKNGMHILMQMERGSINTAFCKPNKFVFAFGCTSVPFH